MTLNEMRAQFARAVTGPVDPSGTPVIKRTNPVLYPVSFAAKFNPLLVPVPIFNVEPDPETARDNYYYNSTENVLYRLLVTMTGNAWKAISL